MYLCCKLLSFTTYDVGVSGVCLADVMTLHLTGSLEREKERSIKVICNTNPICLIVSTLLMISGTSSYHIDLTISNL